MSEVKKTDHSADVLASIKSQVPTVLGVDKYLEHNLIIKNLKKSPKAMIESKGNRERNKIRLTHYQTQMPWIREVTVKIKTRVGQQREEDPNGASGSAQPPSKDDDQSSKKPWESDASALQINFQTLTQLDWQITDTKMLLKGCDKERKIALSISKLKAARYLDFGLKELVPSLWVESEREYDISAVYGITHWWFRRKEFYINKHKKLNLCQTDRLSLLRPRQHVDKKTLACGPKEYDEKGGAIALTRWIEKMENVLDNSGCSENQRVKYAASSFVSKALTWWNTQIQARVREVTIGMTWNDFKALLVEEFYPSNEMERLENEFWNHKRVGANHAAYTDQFHELAKLVPHLVTLESTYIKRYVAGLAPEIRGMLKATQPTTIQDAILRAGILTDEAISCGTLSKSNEKWKAVEETSKSRGSWRDKKKVKRGAGFVATSPPRNEFVGSNLRCAKCYTYHPENGPCKVCYNCQKPGHFAKDCRALFKQVALVNVVRMEFEPGTCYECGIRENNGNQATGRAFNVNVNVVEALQDPNMVTGTFSLNDPFATVLFDFRADFSFISTEFTPLVNVKPSIVNPSYVIEVADDKKVEVDRIIRDYKLELGNSLFSINLIPLVHGSFDVIMGMDWLSQNKVVIVCHEKVVEIPLEGSGILRVQGERTLGATKALMNAKVDEPKLSDISVVRDFVDVFPEDLLGLPPQRQVEFRIDLVSGATPVVKSPYRLKPSEMQELSGQL
ncbi:putative reverse transcriptase domain-containing protein [Tanacetum coccineum]